MHSSHASGFVPSCRVCYLVRAEPTLCGFRQTHCHAEFEKPGSILNVSRKVGSCVASVVLRTGSQCNEFRGEIPVLRQQAL